MSRAVILDLCAGSGAWGRPYRDAGYDVRHYDLPSDVRLEKYPGPVHGILAAPPCTVFSYARNRYPPTDAELLAALSVVDACLRLVVVCRPSWWALENPLNKLRRYLGPPTMTFKQWEYGDPAHKPTGLWGKFTIPMKCVGVRTKPSTFQTSTGERAPGRRDHAAAIRAGVLRKQSMKHDWGALLEAVDRALKAYDWHLANPSAPIAGVAALDARLEELRSIARRVTGPAAQVAVDPDVIREMDETP